MDILGLFKVRLNRYLRFRCRRFILVHIVRNVCSDCQTRKKRYTSLVVLPVIFSQCLMKRDPAHVWTSVTLVRSHAERGFYGPDEQNERLMASVTVVHNNCSVTRNLYDGTDKQHRLAWMHRACLFNHSPNQTNMTRLKLSTKTTAVWRARLWQHYSGCSFRYQKYTN